MLAEYILSNFHPYFHVSDVGWVGVCPAVRKVKNPTAMQETQVHSVGWKGPLEKKMVTHTSILPQRIPRTEEPGGLQSMGSQRVRYDWVTNSFSFHFQCCVDGAIQIKFIFGNNSFLQKSPIWILGSWGRNISFSWTQRVSTAFSLSGKRSTFWLVLRPCHPQAHPYYSTRQKVLPSGGASLVAQMAKNLPAMPETQVWSLGQEDPPENGMATHSSIPAWRIPWTEESGGLQFTGSPRVGHDWATFYSIIFRRWIIWSLSPSVILDWGGKGTLRGRTLRGKF